MRHPMIEPIAWTDFSLGSRGGSTKIWMSPNTVETILGVSSLILWLVGAFALRRDVKLYYSGREGVPFPLNPVLTACFGPWYIGGRLRADFPLDDSGRVGAGVMKVV